MHIPTRVLTCIALLWTLSVHAQGRGNPRVQFEGQSVDAMIAEFMDANDIPGMSLAIVQAPYITRATGYGVSDPRRQTLVSVNTMFDIAGMKSAFTAVAAMQLVEQGKLELAQVLPLIRDPRQSAKLEEAVAQASGQSYPAYVRAGQFAPLGLKHTFFGSELPSVAREAIEPGGRHQRFLREPGLINPTEPAVSVVPRGAPVADAIYSSSSDVSVWDIALAGEILIQDPALRKLLYEPRSASIPSSGPWFFPGRPGLMVATGSANGFSSLLSRFTHRDELLCVTLLASREGVDLTQLARRIAGAFNPRLGPPPEAAGRHFQQSPYSVPDTVARLERAYRKRSIDVNLSDGGRVMTDFGTTSVSEKDGQVWIIVETQGRKRRAQFPAGIRQILLDTIAPAIE